MRRLVTIQKIEKLYPIIFLNEDDVAEEATNIELAQVLGWHVVVQKGLYKEGDLCIYAEIDSIFPELPVFEFLRPKKFRIKTVKIKGQVSQGICFPLSILDELPKVDKEKLGDIDEKDIKTLELVEDADVTDLIGVIKYDPELAQERSGNAFLGGSKGNFPGFLVKTDQTRIQAMPKLLAKYKGQKFVITEKLDGSSMTIYNFNDEKEICSRNLKVKEDEKNAFWKVNYKYDILNRIPTGFAIQGELVGPGVQKNKYKLEELDVYFFDVYDINKAEYLFPEDAEEFIKKLDLKFVPNLGIIELPDSVDELVKMSEVTTSALAPVLREGLVFKASKSLGILEDPNLKIGRLSFKVISPKFLLENKL